MKIKVKYDKMAQTEAIYGPFVFIKDGDKIRNLEAGW